MDELPGLTFEDLTHLRRCVDLALEAPADGDAPFGSVLADPDGAVLHELHGRHSEREVAW